jgi:hypothetical protein
MMFYRRVPESVTFCSTHGVRMEHARPLWKKSGWRKKEKTSAAVCRTRCSFCFDAPFDSYLRHQAFQTSPYSAITLSVSTIDLIICHRAADYPQISKHGIILEIASQSKLFSGMGCIYTLEVNFI